MDLLTASRGVIRSRARTSSYWIAAEQLTRLWVGDPLLSSAEFYIAAGADLSSIDWLYDENTGPGESGAEALVRLTRRLQEMTNLETATREVRRLEEEGLGAGASVEDATGAIIAVLTMAGVEALTRRGSAELALRWQRAWADVLSLHAVQQQRICGIGLLPRVSPDARRRCMQTLGLGPEDLVPRATSFSEGVEEFLHRYGDTSAGSVALLGSLAFSALPLEELNGLLELYAGPSSLLRVMDRLLRLAPDVSFDPAEAINTGVFAAAAEQRRSLLDVVAEVGGRRELHAALGPSGYARGRYGPGPHGPSHTSPKRAPGQRGGAALAVLRLSPPRHGGLRAPGPQARRLARAEPFLLFALRPGPGVRRGARPQGRREAPYLAADGQPLRRG
jgi:hypothetical protein